MQSLFSDGFNRQSPVSIFKRSIEAFGEGLDEGLGGYDNLGGHYETYSIVRDIELIEVNFRYLCQIRNRAMQYMRILHVRV